MAEHTPGPWAIRKISERLYGVNDAGGSAVADLHAIQGKRTNANARLIAAAPDLLSSLSEVLDAFVPTLKSGFRLTQAQGGAVANARAAIAKAEGKIIEFPATETDQQIGDGSNRL